MPKKVWQSATNASTANSQLKSQAVGNVASQEPSGQHVVVSPFVRCSNPAVDVQGSAGTTSGTLSPHA